MEKDVTRHIEEQLSAFLDGELPEEELALLVRRLERDESYRATLDRYALIGGALRNDGDAGISMRRGIMSALEESPVEEVPEVAEEVGSSRSGGMRYMLAATALVGVMAVFFAGNFGSQTGSDGAVPLAATESSAQQVVTATMVADSSTLDEPSALDKRVDRHQRELRRIRMNQERMRSYLISHGEYASPLQGSIANSRMYVQQASFSE